MDIESLKLRKGAHDTREMGLCVMEAVAWVAGEEHTDMPKCASPVISKFCQALNDRGDDAVRERLKSYIPKIIGTVSPDLDEKRAFIAADFAVRVFAPIALRRVELREDAERLEQLPRIIDRASAHDAAASASAASAYATAYAAASAAYAAAYAAASASASYAYAAAYAAASAYDAAAAAEWGHAFRCLDAMLWPTP
jgi:hypothetical protein